MHGLESDFEREIAVDLPIVEAAVYAFYVTYSVLPDDDFPGLEEPSEKVKAETSKTSPTHYINVSPVITLNGERIPLDSLSIFSVVSKFMGAYPAYWNRHFRGISNRGYNAVHFTPLVKRGASDSPYSLYDQLVFDEKYFPNGEADVEGMVKRMEREYGLLALTDVVWNHTAGNTQWLQQHPQAGYCVETAPWLEAPLELDTTLLEYGEQLGDLVLPTEFKSVEDLRAVVDGMREHVVDKIRLWEYYTVNVERDTSAVLEMWEAGRVRFPSGGFGEVECVGILSEIRKWSVKQQAQFLREKALLCKEYIFGRYTRAVQPEIAAALVTALHGRFEQGVTDIAAVKDELVTVLDELNLPLFQEFDHDVAEIYNQLFNRTKYLRLDDHGPKLGPVTRAAPLIESYFTWLPLNENTQSLGPTSRALVNNGWVWNADATKDIAGIESRAYLRREVVVWSDCVKLRYGQRPESNLWLWRYMKHYTRLMAKHFAAFRIDNCHSTPLHVAEYMLDHARQVRPNLLVFAELFTGSEETDYVFTKRLGLTSLIREAMQAGGTAELSRLVHRHGGRPLGSFDVGFPCQRSRGDDQVAIEHVEPTSVHALFMDCTHDNEMPAQKRDARDTLPNAALVAMCASAVGSVFGYDEIYPRRVSLVRETGLYASPYSDGELTDSSAGIGSVRKLLNELHARMAAEGYDETYIHHEDGYITVHRVHPHTRKGILLIAHTAFGGPDNAMSLKPIHLTGTKARSIGAWKLEVDEEEKGAMSDTTYLQGLPSRVVKLTAPEIEERGNDTMVHSPVDLVAGSIALFETWIPASELPEALSEFITSGAEEAFSSLDPVDLNFVLYRCDAEERDSSDGKDGVYVIPNCGALVYAGLQGWWSVLENIVKENDLGHPLCDNLRSGQWALDYIVGRMQRGLPQVRYQTLQPVADWLRQRFDAVRKVPNFLLPRYFALVVRTAYEAAWKRGLDLLGERIGSGQLFIHQLSMVSVQQVGLVESASLYPTTPVPCLAAGLPHFSTGWARCWGRDVFISLRGLFLCTGRFDVAAEHIRAFAGVLKHGLIPNLLSSGRSPRYNSRDAVWFFLQAIQEYADIVPNGVRILEEEVPRRFLPYDDTWFPHNDPRAYSKGSTIAEIIQEILQRHALGISFREHNAGPELDMQMRPDGFQVDVSVDWDTGIAFGGNQWNCGTWMDKMGESEKAGNKGYPGTPRDGAAIEITGLVYSALVWVSKLHREGRYKNEGVEINLHKDIVTFDDWAGRIRTHFERCYYVPLEQGQDSQYDIDSKIANRRGIYKDLYRSSKPFEDYQLRPNFTIAMTVAPDLFDPHKAIHALHLADRQLRGSTGMATLDLADLNYRPFYNNADDSADFMTARGRNYHQGPEWLWPTGYFLRAFLKFGLMTDNNIPRGRKDVLHHVSRRLRACKRAMSESPWGGLAELTNKDGAFCGDSVSA